MNNDWLSEKITYISALKNPVMLKNFYWNWQKSIPYTRPREKTECLDQG